MDIETRITSKGKIGQFFCRHKNTDWFKKKSTFHALNGDTQYKVCKDCGKVVDSIFMPYHWL